MENTRGKRNYNIARALGWKIVSHTDTELRGFAPGSRILSEVPEFETSPVEELLIAFNQQYPHWNLHFDRGLQVYRFVGSTPYMDTMRKYVDVWVEPKLHNVWAALDFIIERNFSPKAVKQGDYLQFKPTGIEDVPLLPAGSQK